MVVKQTNAGYGFSVKGSCPAVVGDVDKRTPAYEAGLRRGDYVVRINGQNVSRSSADSITRIIRLVTVTERSQRYIILYTVDVHT